MAEKKDPKSKMDLDKDDTTEFQVSPSFYRENTVTMNPDHIKPKSGETEIPEISDGFQDDEIKLPDLEFPDIDTIRKKVTEENAANKDVESFIRFRDWGYWNRLEKSVSLGVIVCSGLGLIYLGYTIGRDNPSDEKVEKLVDEEIAIRYDAVLGNFTESRERYESMLDELNVKKAQYEEARDNLLGTIGGLVDVSLPSTSLKNEVVSSDIFDFMGINVDRIPYGGPNHKRELYTGNLEVIDNLLFANNFRIVSGRFATVRYHNLMLARLYEDRVLDVHLYGDGTFDDSLDDLVEQVVPIRSCLVRGNSLIKIVHGESVVVDSADGSKKTSTNTDRYTEYVNSLLGEYKKFREALF